MIITLLFFIFYYYGYVRFGAGYQIIVLLGAHEYGKLTYSCDFLILFPGFNNSFADFHLYFIGTKLLQNVDTELEKVISTHACAL